MAHLKTPVTVTFEETGKELVVERTCNRCYGRAISVLELADVELVSRYGTAHHGADGGYTACGINATGPGWWHRL